MAPEIVKSAVGNGPAPAITAPTHAYVTFLAGDGDYYKGVVGLAKGLRKVGAAFPLVVAVLPDVPAEHRRLLVEQGCLVREIEPVFPPAVAGGGTPYVRPYFVVNYCKLRLWEFVEYERMIYMDADIQVFDNIDHLFDLPTGYFYGVVDCLCEMEGKPCPEKLQWPEQLGPQPSYYLNGGMFVFEPKMTTYRHLIDTLMLTPPTSFAEQDFLNMFFRDSMKPIPYIYNLLVAMLWRHPEAVNLERAKVVHYCMAASKPWRYTGEGEHMGRADIEMLVSKWWDIYDDVSLDFSPEHAQCNPSVFDSDAPEGKKLASALSGAEVVVRYRSASSAA